MASSSTDVKQLNDKTIAIPKKVHFVWLGGPIPDDDKKLIIDWAQKTRSSGYQIQLWTDAMTLNDPLRSEQLRAEGVLLKDWREASVDEDPRYKKIRGLAEQIVLEGQTPGGRINYSAISDLLRFLIVHSEGGLYNDTDNFIVKAPEQIGDIWVDQLSGTRILEGNACILAGIPGAAFVSEVLDYFAALHDEGMAAYHMKYNLKVFAHHTRFRNYEDKEGFLPPKISDERINSVAYWVTRSDLTEAMPAMGDEIITTKVRRSILFMMTMRLTGPSIICNKYRQFTVADPELRYFPAEKNRFMPEALPGIYELNIDKGHFVITEGMSVADGQKGSWYSSRYNFPEGFNHFPLYHGNTQTIPKKIHQIILNNRPYERTLGRGIDFTDLASEEGYTTTLWGTGVPEGSLDSSIRYRNWLDLKFTGSDELEARDYLINQLGKEELTENERVLCELMISTLILLHEGGLILPCGYGNWAEIKFGDINVPVETGVRISAPQSILSLQNMNTVKGLTYLPSVIASSPEINARTHYLEQMLVRLIALTKTNINQLSTTTIQDTLIKPLMNESLSVESASTFTIYRVPPVFYSDHLVWIGDSFLFYNTAPKAMIGQKQAPISYGFHSNDFQERGSSNQALKFFQSEAASSEKTQSLPNSVNEINVLIRNAFIRCPMPDNYSIKIRQVVLNQFLYALIQAEEFMTESTIFEDKEIKEPMERVIKALYYLGTLDGGQLPKIWEGQFALNLLSELRGKPIIKDSYMQELAELELQVNELNNQSNQKTGVLNG